MRDFNQKLSIYFELFLTITVSCRLKIESVEKSPSYFVASSGFIIFTICVFFTSNSGFTNGTVRCTTLHSKMGCTFQSHAPLSTSAGNIIRSHTLILISFNRSPTCSYLNCFSSSRHFCGLSHCKGFTQPSTLS